MDNGIGESCTLWKRRNAPNGIRIRVCGLKGRCPRPLDDGGTRVCCSEQLGRQRPYLLLRRTDSRRLRQEAPIPSGREEGRSYDIRQPCGHIVTLCRIRCNLPRSDRSPASVERRAGALGGRDAGPAWRVHRRLASPTLHRYICRCSYRPGLAATVCIGQRKAI